MTLLSYSFGQDKSRDFEQRILVVWFVRQEIGLPAKAKVVSDLRVTPAKVFEAAVPTLVAAETFP